MMPFDEQNLIDYSVTILGETEKAKFPLILVFGRESNGSRRLLPGLSIYDETVSSGSKFWNSSYKYFERLSGWGGHLRNDCIRSNLSPILLTNTLPNPQLNSIENKDLERNSLPDKLIQNHIEGIFNLPTVATRVRAVIVSTGPKAAFDRPKVLIRDWCDENNILNLELPYFATQGQKNSVLDEALTRDQTAPLRMILDEFHEAINGY